MSALAWSILRAIRRSAPVLYSALLAVQAVAAVWCWIVSPDWLPIGDLAGQEGPTIGLRGQRATSLPGGQVLISGGGTQDGIFTNRAARYDVGTSQWTPAAPMLQERASHEAFALPDGRVLVIGGTGTGRVALDTVEIYDPVVDRWSVAGTLSPLWQRHHAVMLKNGFLLLVGGSRQAPQSAGVYDPTANAWRGAPVPGFTSTNSAITLANGHALVLGTRTVGINTAPWAERYDPRADRWIATQPPPVDLSEDAPFVLLRDGRVLVAGGSQTVGHSIATRTRVLNAAYIYDPASDQWSRAEPLHTARTGHSLTVLDDGTVIAAGGQTGERRLLKGVERYDPTTGHWRSVASLPEWLRYPQAVALPGAELLVFGGSTPLCYGASNNRWLRVSIPNAAP